MYRFLIRRLAQAVPVLVLSSIGVFLVMRMIPGDPALVLAGPDASQAQVAAIRQGLGLNRPIPVQLWLWLTHVLRGDLGASYINGQTVTSLIGQRMPATLELAAAALIIVLIVGIPLGMLGAVPGKRARTAISGQTMVMLGIPGFWFGMLLVILFSLILGWLPPGGRPGVDSSWTQQGLALILPAVTLAFQPTAVVIRFMRASALETLGEDFIRTARAKGLPPWQITVHHTARNSLMPVITVIGIEAGRLVASAVVVETLFSWPGIGRLLVQSILNRDYTVVQAILLLFVGLFLILNLVVDVLYAVLDPRIRLGNVREAT